MIEVFAVVAVVARLSCRLFIKSTSITVCLAIDTIAVWVGHLFDTLSTLGLSRHVESGLSRLSGCFYERTAL